MTTSTFYRREIGDNEDNSIPLYQIIYKERLTKQNRTAK